MKAKVTYISLMLGVVAAVGGAARFFESEASAADVSINWQTLHADGSNLQSSGLQFAGTKFQSPNVNGGLLAGPTFSGLDFNLNPSQIGVFSNDNGNPNRNAGNYGDMTDTVLQDVLSSNVWDYDADGISITISGLTAGQTYRAQFLSWDSPGAQTFTTKPYDDRFRRTAIGSAGNMVNGLLGGTVEFIGAPLAGYPTQQSAFDSTNPAPYYRPILVTAEWTADDSFISFNFLKAGNNTGVHLNAVAVSNISIPEPSSLSLLSLASFGLLGIMRRRVK